MITASRRAVLAQGASRGAVRVVRRRLATEAGEAAKSAEEASLNIPPPTPKKKRGFVRTTLLYTGAVGATFYAGSTMVALHENRYHDFFVESVPLGESIMDYAEAQEWDKVELTKLPGAAVDLATSAYSTVEGAVSRVLGNAPTTPQLPSSAAEVKEAAKSTARKTSQAVSSGVTFVKKKAEEAPAKAAEVVDEVKAKSLNFSQDVKDLVDQAEKALAGVPAAVESAASAVAEATESVPSPPSADGKNVWTAALPLGFEPPPGYSRPAPPKKASKKNKASTPLPPTPPLPLVAPAVKELSASEPVIAQIASSIDGLATLLKDSPASASGASDILSTAQLDLLKLGERIEVIKKDEQAKLEQQLDEQAKDYSLKILQLEVDSQDKIDAQEEGFKSLLEEEKQSILALYREKLANELETQSEIINQRLKEEVIAQGIEMQRRWIREIKVRVESERGGRLAKLSELATQLKKLERVTIDNSEYLDENVRLHTLSSALRTFASALDSPVRRPFRDELRVLRHVSAAKEDPLIGAALDSIESTEVPDIGVEPLGDLINWFLTSVGPAIERVALVPDTDAGVLSHLASSALSLVRFKRAGLVEGGDVLSVVSRAEHYLAEKDLDSAARELNQLKGTPKVLLADWLAASRKRLEVEQALQIIRSQTSLSSILVV